MKTLVDTCKSLFQVKYYTSTERMTNNNFMLGMENLPSEIQYHWAEIRNRYDQARGFIKLI